jgi:uncharacterized membrane protein YfcA
MDGSGLATAYVVVADVDLPMFLVLAVAVFVGSALQGVVGIGLGLVSAPIIGLTAPELLPGLALWVALFYPMLTLTRDWRHADPRGLTWALVARLPGTAVGVWLVAVAPDRLLKGLVGAMVLVAVAVTARSVHVKLTRPTLAGAGFVSGITGTSTSIDGPPLAIVYQREEPDVLRSTLGAYFVAGAAMSLVGLGVSGEMTVQEFQMFLFLTPVLLLGFLVSGPMRTRLDHARVRRVLLSVCAASATLLVVRALVG